MKNNHSASNKTNENGNTWESIGARGVLYNNSKYLTNRLISNFVITNFTGN